MKSLQGIKDEYANQEGYNNWAEMYNDWCNNYSVLEEIIDNLISFTIKHSVKEHQNKL